MEYIVKDRKPASMFKYFEEICKIPHGSGNEGGIADYVCAFAEKHKLECYRDEANNVLIKKKASEGAENGAPVMLQGHMDMVCEKTSDTIHDFMRDPLDLYIEDGWLRARGTTLGGDDGAAVAMMLAVLDDENLRHPALECLFTTGEETSMVGANAFDFSKISARKIINLDSEEEGIVTISCAGGADTLFELPVERTAYEGRSIRLSIRGLAGGHSGSDIAMCRANANRVMARLLAELYADEPFRLVSISGGSKRNAIAREADAEICVLDEKKATERLLESEKKIFGELCPADANMRLHIGKGRVCEKAMTYRSTSAVINMILLPDNGVVAMSPSIKDFVRTSSNMGIVTTDENCVRADAMSRSSCESEHDALLLKFSRIAKLIGAEAKVCDRYFGWEPAADSKLVADYVETFERQNPGKKAVVAGIHAGLECGVIISKIGEPCDAISIGPDMRAIHTPDEALSLSSCERTYALLAEMLEKM